MRLPTATPNQDGHTMTTVCIPWRETSERTAAFKRVIAFWRHHGYDIVTADSQRNKPFNLSAARNNAVAQAHSGMVIITDADVIPDIAAVQKAITETSTDSTIFSWPYMTYRYIAADQADEPDLLTAKPSTRQLRQNHVVWAPPMICHRKTYWNAGAYDEKFNGWGGEDDAFYYAVHTLYKVHRYEGTAFSIDHSDAKRDISDQSCARYELYQQLHGNKRLMRELVR